MIRAASVAAAVGLAVGVGASVPSLTVPHCDERKPAVVSDFELSSGTGKFPAQTYAVLCWTREHLEVAFAAKDDPFLRNDYSECNSDTYNQEVAEIFISSRQPATGSSSDFVTRYLEIEITPHNTLYVAHIHNPYGNGTNKTNVLVDCHASGVEHEAKSDQQRQQFEASLRVPWALINGHNDAGKNHSNVAAAPGDKYVGNLFRVVMNKNVSMCDSDTCAYGAWSPTFDNPPQFHVSTAFGHFELV
eukprot:INCI8831.1.p1 GENE.INCI8831.1~~INCI8831.1.p1  ORF type:complete len:246 (-),score=43.79 INCI8831.1:535-1272(-)